MIAKLLPYLDMQKRLFKNNRIVILAKKYDIKLIILFGSRAKSRFGFKKDIDIAILTQRRFGTQDEYDMFKDFIQFFKSDNLDFAILNFASPLLRFQVAKDGKPLYEKEQGEFRKFQLMAIKDYWSNCKFLKFQQLYLNKVVRQI